MHALFFGENLARRIENFKAEGKKFDNEEMHNHFIYSVEGFIRFSLSGRLGHDFTNFVNTFY